MKIQGITPEDLHDAVLESFSFVWDDGICHMLFRVTPDKSWSIMFQGVTNFVVPREQPWGPSVCVNEFRHDPDGNVEIEMQSGDVIKLHAESAMLMT